MKILENPQIKQFLDANLYLTLATVCADGRPWGTPLRYAASGDYVYWSSDLSAVHSQNIITDPNIFITIFDANVPKEQRRALYIETYAELLSGDEAKTAAGIMRADNPVAKHLTGDAPYFRARIPDIDPLKSHDNNYYCRKEEI